MSAFASRDLYLSAYLKTQGFVLTRCIYDNGRCTFEFDGDPAALTRAVQEFLGGSALVNALAYSSCVREVKSLTVSARNAHNNSYGSTHATHSR